VGVHYSGNKFASILFNYYLLIPQYFHFIAFCLFKTANALRAPYQNTIGWKTRENRLKKKSNTNRKYLHKLVWNFCHLPIMPLIIGEFSPPNRHAHTEILRVAFGLQELDGETLDGCLCGGLEFIAPRIINHSQNEPFSISPKLVPVQRRIRLGETRLPWKFCRESATVPAVPLVGVEAPDPVLTSHVGQ
jgi:hypothetical protein